MKKNLLPLLALLLSAQAAGAKASGAQSADGMRTVLTPMNMDGQARKAFTASRIADNQKYVFTPGADDPVSGYGLPANAGKVTRMGSVIPATYLEAYAGAKIVGMRFLTQSAQLVTPHLCDAATCGELASAPSMQTSASPLNDEHTAFDEHWNEVAFATPYEIPASPASLMPVFDYVQVETKDANGYPFLMGKTSDKEAPIMAYGDTGNGEQWNKVRTGNTLCVQLLIEKEGGSFGDDLSIVSVIADPMTEIEEMELFPFQFIVRNASDGECDDYQCSIMLDGKEIGYTESVPGYGVGKAGVVHSTGFYPSRYGLKDGVHRLGVKVRKVNGTEPAGDTSDDLMETDLRIYSNSVERQQNLVEFFTSNTEDGSAIGYDALRRLQKQRDDVAWVGIHVNADSSHPDPMTVDGGRYIYSYSATSCPAFNVNRRKTDDENYFGSVALNYSGESAATLSSTISNALDSQAEKIASLVTLDMKTSLAVPADPATQSAVLTVTVSGHGVENASKILDTAVLGLYVTENGYTDRQYADGKWDKAYSHDNVLRAVGTDDAWGDQIVWYGDNFERTYEVSVPAGSYDYDSDRTLNAVAFVSLPFAWADGDGAAGNPERESVWVDQCLSKTVGKDDITGIKTVGASESAATVVARYAADGMRIEAPAKGVNILRMSDGTSRKVIVSK